MVKLIPIDKVDPKYNEYNKNGIDVNVTNYNTYDLKNILLKNVYLANTIKSIINDEYIIKYLNENNYQYMDRVFSEGGFLFRKSKRANDKMDQYNYISDVDVKADMKKYNEEVNMLKQMASVYGIYDLNDVEFCFFSSIDDNDRYTNLLRPDKKYQDDTVYYAITSTYCTLYKGNGILYYSPNEYIKISIENAFLTAVDNSKENRRNINILTKQFIVNQGSIMVHIYSLIKYICKLFGYTLENIKIKKILINNENVNMNEKYISLYKFYVEIPYLSSRDYYEYLIPNINITLSSENSEKHIDSSFNILYHESIVNEIPSTISTYINPSVDTTVGDTSYKYYTQQYDDDTYYVPYKVVSNEPLWKYPIIKKCIYKMTKDKKIEKVHEGNDANDIISRLLGIGKSKTKY